MRYIFIDSKEGVDRVGIVEEGRLVEFHMGKQEDRKMVGNIYRARVMNVLKGMEAAFVDIGAEKNAYLRKRDALPSEKLYDKSKNNISDIIKPGDEIIVQVVKEPVGDKGAKISTHIDLPGRYLVLTPYSSKKNVSRKIFDRDEIKRLKAIGGEIIRGNAGMIFRTAAEGIEKSLLEEEYKLLYNIYKKIEKERNFLPCPKLIYKEPDLGYQLVRNSYNAETSRIIVNTRQAYNRLVEMEEHYLFEFRDKIILDLDFSIELDLDISAEISRALGRMVDLKNGGHIVIDEVEALTAIDVNTGKFIGSKSLKDTILKTNIEAAKEIARQIRLRDIGGIIIVDFIDMKNKKDTSIVLSILEEYLNKDSVRTNIIGITKLGLVELTRKKTRGSLSSDFQKICPVCMGRGNIVDIKY